MPSSHLNSATNHVFVSIQDGGSLLCKHAQLRESTTLVRSPDSGKMADGAFWPRNAPLRPGPMARGSGRHGNEWMMDDDAGMWEWWVIWGEWGMGIDDGFAAK